MDRSWWTVTFDVPGNRDRYALTQQLRRHGVRALYSVFDVHASDREMDRLLAASRDHLAHGGHLLALPSCPECEIAEHGHPAEHLPSHGWISP